MSPAALLDAPPAAGAGLREAVLRAHGAGDAELAPLLAYTANAFALPADGLPTAWPLPDEPFAGAWAEYAEAARTRGAWPVLRDALVQLRFPIRAGMSAHPAYAASTRRGEAPPAGEGVELRDPDGLSLFLHPTPAGRVPVVVAGCRDDFEALVRALTRRNEPDAIPASMGACMVGGYNNWSRVAGLRREWAARTPGAGPAEWSAEFARIAQRKELYQDRFILLARGPYSAVPAAALGMADEEWNRASLTIRLEHECAHYFTRRVLGSMRNALHDELLADFAGVTAAAGRFRADWFLRFMGLEAADYREGGRLQNYRGDPPLEGRAFHVLCSLVRAAAENLRAAHRPVAHEGLAGRARALAAIASVGLEEIAHPSFPERWPALLG